MSKWIIFLLVLLTLIFGFLIWWFYSKKKESITVKIDTKQLANEGSTTESYIDNRVSTHLSNFIDIVNQKKDEIEAIVEEGSTFSNEQFDI